PAPRLGAGHRVELLGAEDLPRGAIGGPEGGGEGRRRIGGRQQGREGGRAEDEGPGRVAPVLPGTGRGAREPRGAVRGRQQRRRRRRGRRGGRQRREGRQGWRLYRPALRPVVRAARGTPPHDVAPPPARPGPDPAAIPPPRPLDRRVGTGPDPVPGRVGLLPPRTDGEAVAPDECAAVRGLVRECCARRTAVAVAGPASGGGRGRASPCSTS
ncbi:hypothetical protein THAOC_07222, partial [Thalassiosira oceanica]